MEQTLISVVMKHTIQFPSKIALIVNNKKITYGELGQSILNAAQIMREYGVCPGSRVILSATPSPAFVFGYFATHILGAIAIPVDPQISDKNLNMIIEETNAKQLFLAKGKTASSISIEELMLPAIYNDKEFNVIPVGEDVADILFTTGTTSRSKGVVLTHKGILSAAQNINQFIGNTADDREIVPLPLSHSFGLGRLRCNMLVGGTIIMCESVANIKNIFDNMKIWKATGFVSVPAGFALLLKLSGNKLGEYAHQLKFIEIGSAPMEMKMKQRLMELLPNTRICMHYGLTEASRSCFIEFHRDKEKLTSVGKAAPNVKVKIMDENKNDLSSGSEGSIFVSGDHVMKQYLNKPELTSHILNDGWLDTGDYGKLDDEGYLYLKGRKKEIINVGGRKVSPDEIEEYLNEIDYIKESACVGVSDPLGISGEIIKAFIVLDEKKVNAFSKTQIIAYLRNRVEPYKIPTQFEVIEKIPRTSSGKMQRQLLKV
ncbi:class I adenylate-forming enzyme family protein [Clostridium beijerinckii]|uniref:class I adenylate-forming enzyme family protein n=1 Tax=Clostridium beijerinckii TaxID=1520 RepID=UPI001F3A3BEB|nr:class I adenylate-forming enzyme family protein [Clostridium beijerinckii]